MIKEFRDFIARGNLVEIAVAFVMGAAFGGVVSTLTSRIVSPLLAMIVDLSALDNVWTFGPVDPATGHPQGSVGALVGAVINFVIVALVMFFTCAGNQAPRPAEEAEPSRPRPRTSPSSGRSATLLRGPLVTPNRGGGCGRPRRRHGHRRDVHRRLLSPPLLRRGGGRRGARLARCPSSHPVAHVPLRFSRRPLVPAPVHRAAGRPSRRSAPTGGSTPGESCSRPSTRTRRAASSESTVNNGGRRRRRRSRRERRSSSRRAGNPTHRRGERAMTPASPPEGSVTGASFTGAFVPRPRKESPWTRS